MGDVTLTLCVTEVGVKVMGGGGKGRRGGGGKQKRACGVRDHRLLEVLWGTDQDWE